MIGGRFLGTPYSERLAAQLRKLSAMEVPESEVLSIANALAKCHTLFVFSAQIGIVSGRLNAGDQLRLGVRDAFARELGGFQRFLDGQLALGPDLVGCVPNSSILGIVIESSFLHDARRGDGSRSAAPRAHARQLFGHQAGRQHEEVEQGVERFQ